MFRKQPLLDYGIDVMQLQEYNKRTANKAVVSLLRTWLHYLRSMCGLQLLTMLSDFCSAFCEFSDGVSTRYRWPWSISWYCLVVVNSFTACFWPGYSDWCRCILRQIIFGCFLLGLAPFVLLLCCFGDETQVWLGDLRVVLVCVFAVLCDDLPFYRYWPIELCTPFFTAYVVIRTVPQSIYGQTREKKNALMFRKRAY